MGVDMGSVGEHLVERGAGEQASLMAGMPSPDSVVVRVEEVAELRMENFIPLAMGTEQEGFEEPGRVGQVPLGRAAVGHRLGTTIFRFEIADEALAEFPDGRVVVRCGHGTGRGDRISSQRGHLGLGHALSSPNRGR